MPEKYIPSRMCVVCRGVHPKSEMIRVVRTQNGEYALDKSGKAFGRGAYVCPNEDCLAKCVKRQAFNKSFKAGLPEEIYETIGTAIKKD